MVSKEKIINMIINLSGKYSAYSIFSDWVECMALGIQNTCTFFHGDTYKQRERQYLALMQKYNASEQMAFCEMAALLCESLEEKIEDALGDIYMRSGCGSKVLGQYFTPFHLSQLCSDLALPDDISESNPYLINEPSVGGGGMIIAVACTLKNRGLNYQKCMKVVAQDLDWHGVYMSYVQFSLLGLDAVVVQGDTLSEPFKASNYPESRVFKTPRREGALL